MGRIRSIGRVIMHCLVHRRRQDGHRIIRTTFRKLVGTPCLFMTLAILVRARRRHQEEVRILLMERRRGHQVSRKLRCEAS
jgi:hypothetical protein